MFNAQYTKVSAEADVLVRMRVVHLLRSYIKQYPVPPPLNVPALLLDVAYHALVQRLYPCWAAICKRRAEPTQFLKWEPLDAACCAAAMRKPPTIYEHEALSRALESAKEFSEAEWLALDVPVGGAQGLRADQMVQCSNGTFYRPVRHGSSEAVARPPTRRWAVIKGNEHCPRKRALGESDVEALVLQARVKYVRNLHYQVCGGQGGAAPQSQPCPPT